MKILEPHEKEVVYNRHNLKQFKIIFNYHEYLCNNIYVKYEYLCKSMYVHCYDLDLQCTPKSLAILGGVGNFGWDLVGGL